MAPTRSGPAPYKGRAAADYTHLDNATQEGEFYEVEGR